MAAMSPSRAVNLVPGTIAAGRAVRIGRPVRPRINRSVDYRYDVAFDERLALRVRAVLGEGPDVDERLMFGGLAFMVGDNLACGVVTAGRRVRLGAEEAEKALRQPHVRPMDFTGRPMRTTVFVEPPGTRDE